MATDGRIPARQLDPEALADGRYAIQVTAGKASLVGGGLTVQDENGLVATGVTQVDFQGAGVTAGAGTGEVVVTIPGGGSGSGSGEVLMQDGVTAPPVPLETEDQTDWLYQG